MSQLRPVVLLGLLLAVPAFAGMKTAVEVGVNPTARTAGGGFDATADSSSTSSYMFCRVSLSTTYPEKLECYARDAAGDFGHCYSFDPDFIDLGKSMTVTGTYIYFKWNTSGECTSLEVNKGSLYLP